MGLEIELGLEELGYVTMSCILLNTLQKCSTYSQ